MYASIAELPLVGGHPVIDLVNTWEPRLPVNEREDHFVTPGDVLEWALRAGLITDAEAQGIHDLWAAAPATGRRSLSAVKEIRGAVDTVLLYSLAPGGDPASLRADLEYLRRCSAASVGRGQLLPACAGGAAARLVVGSDPATLIADRLAWRAVELLSGVDVSRLGVCPVEADGCGWLFIDRSRNHSRRWCSMTDCGAQTKARRLTERRRVARTTG